jgi:hypothetical protein
MFSFPPHIATPLSSHLSVPHVQRQQRQQQRARGRAARRLARHSMPAYCRRRRRVAGLQALPLGLLEGLARLCPLHGLDRGHRSEDLAHARGVPGGRAVGAVHGVAVGAGVLEANAGGGQRGGGGGLANCRRLAAEAVLQHPDDDLPVVA